MKVSRSIQYGPTLGGILGVFQRKPLKRLQVLLDGPLESNKDLLSIQICERALKAICFFLKKKSLFGENNYLIT